MINMVLLGHNKGLPVSNTITVEHGTYSSGELYLTNMWTLSELQHMFDLAEPITFTVNASLQTSDSIIKLGLVADHIKTLRKYCDQSDSMLVMGYVPYGRHDKEHATKSADCGMGIRVIGNFISAMNFDRVIYSAEHSDKTNEYIKNGHSITTELVQTSIDWNMFDLANKNVLVVAPDAGAVKLANVVAETISSITTSCKVAACTKTRDAEGDVSSIVLTLDGIDTTSIDCVLVVDDICDGGRSHLAAYDEIKEKLPHISDINLYVFHGIFARGVDALAAKYNKIRALYDWDNRLKDHECMK